MASQHWGGAEKVFVEVSNYLARKHEVYAILLRNTEYKHRFSDKVRMVQLNSHPTRHNPLLLLELYRVLKKIDGDIIHTHAVKASELVFSANKLLKIEHIGTKHNARKGKIFNKLQWVTAVSEEAGNSISQQKDGKIKIIYNGIIPQQIDSSIGDNNFNILAIGRLDKIKGFDVLINQLKNVSYRFKLSIVGEGKEAMNLQKLIDSLGLRNSIFMAGYSDNVPDLMKKADLIVISSHSEGFPKVMIEALFYGNVLLSTPVGGVREIIPSLFLAKQSELGRKIGDIQLNYDHYYTEFQKIKEELAESFTLDRIIQQYESFYDQVLG